MSEDKFLFQVTFLHNRHGTRHVVQVVVPGPEWSAGEAMAIRKARDLFSTELQKKYHGQELLGDYSLLSAVSKGLFIDENEVEDH